MVMGMGMGMKMCLGPNILQSRIILILLNLPAVMADKG